MHLPIIISRFSNFLFFAQKADQHHLIGYDLQEYLTDKHADLLFYGKNKDKIWKQIRKSVGEQNTKQFKKAIAPLSPIFTSHWREASKQLLLWKQYFQNNQPLFHQIIVQVMKISELKHFTLSKIPIYLISDPYNNDKEINAWFSWTPKKSFIVVEIPLSFKVPNNFFPLSVLAHEFFHLMLRKNKSLFSKISKISKENERLFTKLSKSIPNRIFLEELLVSSFIPEGYLSEKYFHTKVATHIARPKGLLAWRKLVAYKLHQTAKKYINDARRIDEKYLKDLTEVVKQNTK